VPSHSWRSSLGRVYANRFQERSLAQGNGEVVVAGRRRRRLTLQIVLALEQAPFFHILQTRPAILEKQLRRPVAAVARHSMATDTIVEGRERRRL
jgi:hypothetical protein